MQAYQLSLVIACVLAIAEVLTFGFVFLSFSLAFLAIAVAQFFTGHASVGRDVVLFALCSILFSVLFRVLFKRKKDQSQPTSEDINSY